MSLETSQLRDHLSIANGDQSKFESNQVSHAAREPWWDAPTPNRLTAAFHIGRLLNQLSWHLQRMFFDSSADKSGADEILNVLEGMSYKFVDEPPNRLKDFINDFRRNYKSQIRSEAASEGKVAFLVDRDPNDEYISVDDRYQILVETWVYPFLHPLEERICEKLTVTEQWALKLGHWLDEGIHHSGLYRIEAERFERHGHHPGDHDKSRARWGVSGVEVRLTPRGEFEVDTAWPHVLRALLAKVGMPTASFDTTLSRWEHANAQDQKNSMPQTLELLDHSIREQLGAYNDDSDGTKPQGITSVTHVPHKEILGELPLGPVRVDGQPEAEQTAKPNIIPNEFRSRILTKKDAAEIHSRGLVANPTKYIDSLVKDLQMTQPQGGGRKWRFDIRDFDQADQAKVCRPSEESSGT